MCLSYISVDKSIEESETIDLINVGTCAAKTGKTDAEENLFGPFEFITDENDSITPIDTSSNTLVCLSIDETSVESNYFACGSDFGQISYVKIGKLDDTMDLLEYSQSTSVLDSNDSGVSSVNIEPPIPMRQSQNCKLNGF